MISAIGLTFLGAFFLGTFALPSKYIKNYAWENTWGAFFLMAMLVVPVGVAIFAVNGLWGTYTHETISGMTIFIVMVMGALWGAGFCCWGYGLEMVGLSLGYSLNMGTMALMGSMIPFFLGSADKARTSGGMLIIGGILVCIAGVAVNGFAGTKREKAEAKEQPADKPIAKKNMLLGLCVCVLAGLLCSGLNIAFHVGGNISKISETEFGNAPWLAGLSTWTLIFLGGMVSSCGFCLFKLSKNKTWGQFKNKGSAKNFAWATVMAVAHFACILFYGMGTGKFPVGLGTSVGFAIFQSGGLLIGNGLGIATGEWRQADKDSKKWMYIGLGILISGIVIVSIGNAIVPAAAGGE
jgi:L-rhamnose-H+ transport protein